MNLNESDCLPRQTSASLTHSSFVLRLFHTLFLPFFSNHCWHPCTIPLTPLMVCILFLLLHSRSTFLSLYHLFSLSPSLIFSSRSTLSLSLPLSAPVSNRRILPLTTWLQSFGRISAFFFFFFSFPFLALPSISMNSMCVNRVCLRPVRACVRARTHAHTLIPTTNCENTG